MASSYATSRAAGSDASGTSFDGLVVAGVPYGASVPANTRVTLPGVGYAVLNEQSQTATGMTVNAIRVVRTDLFGGTVGEIVVASAASSVSR